jgi:hypothetical protein
MSCLRLITAASVALGGCTGTIEGHDTPATPATPAGSVFFQTAIKRLTQRELQQTVLDLTGIDLGAEVNNLPEDWSATEAFAFDNAYDLQQPSPSLIETTNALADLVGSKLLVTPAARTKVVGCTPSGPADVNCFRAFVTTFGRRAIRRPLSTAEIDEIVTKLHPYSMEANDFFFGVSLAVRAFLQDPEFLYRAEFGVPVTGKPGLFKLTDYEVASRLSYFLWGTGPDDSLLNAAAMGLQSPAQVRSIAERMLQPAERRAVAMVNKFHAMWLGYERQPPPQALMKPMLEETNALIERVVFKDRRPIFDLFRSTDSYVNNALAAHYGLPTRPPGTAPTWVPYGASGRQGILSHGTVLGVEKKHTDTSPTMRGMFLRTRLMCQLIPPPGPELMVDVDEAPKEGRCKTQRYDMWNAPGCSTCHTTMDPIGHGLERFDREGKVRSVAPQDLAEGKTDCVITGEGFLNTPDNKFTGVSQLSEKLLASKVIEACFAQQMASFYLGREPRGAETKIFDEVAGRFQMNNFRYDQLLVDLVTLPGFGYRAAE